MNPGEINFCLSLHKIQVTCTGDASYTKSTVLAYDQFMQIIYPVRLPKCTFNNFCKSRVNIEGFWE